MSHGHGHGHGGHAAGRAGDRRRLKVVLAVTASILVVQLVGAWISGSLALLADAGHMATDAAGIVLALGASYVAALPSGRRATFGWHRAEVLAALANAVVLVALCVYLAVAAAGRLLEPTEVAAGPMVGFALVGLVANAVSLLVLSRSTTGSLNMRGATMEVAADTLGSVVVVVAGVVIWTTGFDRADPIGSLLIAAMILPRAVALARDSVAVLLEAAPRDVRLDDVQAHLMRMPGVVDVHDLHAWTITTGLPSLSAHVTVTDEVLDERGVGAILDDLAGCTAAHFAVRHATFQVEPASHRAHEDLGEAH